MLIYTNLISIVMAKCIPPMLLSFQKKIEKQINTSVPQQLPQFRNLTHVSLVWVHGAVVWVLYGCV